jgi:hypothetical protein
MGRIISKSRVAIGWSLLAIMLMYWLFQGSVRALVEIDTYVVKANSSTPELSISDVNGPSTWTFSLFVYAFTYACMVLSCIVMSLIVFLIRLIAKFDVMNSKSRQVSLILKIYDFLDPRDLFSFVYIPATWKAHVIGAALYIGSAIVQDVVLLRHVPIREIQTAYQRVATTSALLLMFFYTVFFVEFVPKITELVPT